MENKIKVWVVKDGEGFLRPVAGIWIDQVEEKTKVNYGEESAKAYEAKNKKHGDTVVLCELAEIKYENTN